MVADHDEMVVISGYPEHICPAYHHSFLGYPLPESHSVSFPVKRPFPIPYPEKLKTCTHESVALTSAFALPPSPLS